MSLVPSKDRVSLRKKWGRGGESGLALNGNPVASLFGSLRVLASPSSLLSGIIFLTPSLPGLQS